MAGITGKSGPPGNQNAFRHGLAAVNNRRAEGELTAGERDIRADILAGLIADSGGEAQISTATRILAEIISSDVALLVTFNQAIEGVIKNNQKARANPKALAQLDGYKRPLVGSPVGESPAVRDGKSRQNGVAAGDYRRDDRGPWNQRENQPRLSNDIGKMAGNDG